MSNFFEFSTKGTITSFLLWKIIVGGKFAIPASIVVNRLRQVTAAIRQDGVNQVSIITSTAERQAAMEFGKAAAVRPAIVGKAMAEIGADSEVAEAMFELLETQRIVEGKVHLTLVRASQHTLLADLFAAESPVAHESIAEIKPKQPRPPSQRA